MKNDLRDERLGKFMDDAVRGIRPPAEGLLQDVLRRGGHRRAARWTATVMALIVFVGAVVWGAATVGGRRIEAFHTNDWTVAGSLGTAGWKFGFPPNWRIQELPACPNAPERTGAVVTSSDFEFRNPLGAAPGCEDRFVLEGFPSDGVALAVMPVGIRVGLFFRTTNTPFPIAWDQLQPTGGIEGGPAASYLGVTVGGNAILFVRTWVGPDASAAEVGKLREVLGTLEVSGAAHWRTDSDAINGFSITYPDDWVRAGHSLTPELAEPRELI